MSEDTRFTVSTPSRHPLLQKGYDSLGHLYRKDYVNPKFWIIHLFFMPQGFKEGADGKIVIPQKFVSIKWTVSKNGLDDQFIEKNVLSSMPNTIVHVPEQGLYSINLRVKLTDGTVESRTRTFRLRDFLVVSIGDSFASGEGNPDNPAIPSVDQRRLCQATTPLMIFLSVKKELGDFVNGSLGNTKRFIKENIPLLGMITVTMADKAGDIGQLIVGQVEGVRKASLSLTRKSIEFITEGIEEVLGVFGIGDGGEFGEVGPRPVTWQEPLAHRSYRSGHSLAAREIEGETFFGADRITFLSFARSGAEINEGLLSRRTDIDVLLDNDISIDGWIGNRDQVQEAEDTIQNRQIDALIISISVNDIGFSNLTTKGVLKASGQDRRDRMAGAARRIEKDLPRNLEKLNDEIERRLKPTKVFITEYPVGVFKEIIEDGPCEVLESKFPEGFDLDSAEAADLTNLGILLNQKIREKAFEFGWVLIDGIEQGFDGHGYCGKRTFFVKAEESCINQGDFEGMLHPNGLGHQLTKECIARALRIQLLPEKWLEPMLHVMMK